MKAMWLDSIRDQLDDWFPTLCVVLTFAVTMVALYFFLPFAALMLAR